MFPVDNKRVTHSFTLKGNIMKTPLILLLALSLVSFGSQVNSETTKGLIGKVQAISGEGKIEKALTIMKNAIEKSPDDSELQAHLGYMYSQEAGKAWQAGDTNDAGMYTELAFNTLDSAVETDADCVMALFYRGTLSINVPNFFDKLDEGIEDLEKIQDLREKKQFPRDILLAALENLAMGYRKAFRFSDSFDTNNTIIEIAPGSQEAQRADQNIRNMVTSETKILSTHELIAKEYPKIAALREKLEKDPDNPELLLTLAGQYGSISDAGYDEHTYNDASYMSNIAFEVVRLLEKAKDSAPDNMEILLLCGRTSVMMPFFVNKITKGIHDLNRVLNESRSDSLKAEAQFWLGYADYKMAVTRWNKVIDEYPKSHAAELTLDIFNTNNSLLNDVSPESPCVVIDFILGFKDELAPQTAVWIEDVNGVFVKTLYVSGFSGFAREKQINLPNWAKSSDFADTDAVTAASIDHGTHRYVWNLKNMVDEIVRAGRYKVHVETSFWPSMNYDRKTVTVEIGKERMETQVEKGRFISAVKAVYFSM